MKRWLILSLQIVHVLTGYPRFLLFAAFIISCCLPHETRAQTGCGVNASFHPGVDTFFSSSRTLSFTNTSTNAASVQWRVNNINASVSNSLNWNFEVGINRVSLIARNGSCTDTFSILVVCTGFPPTEKNYYNGTVGIDGHVNNGYAVAPAADSGVLLAGSTSYQATSFSQLNGLLVKMKKLNCVEWTRLIALPDANTRVFETIGLRDGGFLVCGDAGYIPYVMRINAGGQLQWIKNFTSTYAVGLTQKMYELKDGSIILVLHQNGGSAVTVVKLDVGGNLVWNRFLLPAGGANAHMYSRAILEIGDAVYLTGTYQEYISPFVFGGFLPFLVKLDAANGQVRWGSFYRSGNNRSTTFQTLQLVGDRIFISGTDYITGGSLDPKPCMLWMDTSGNIESGGALKPLNAVKSWNTATAGVLPGGDILMQFRYTWIPPVGLEKTFSNYILLDGAMAIRREQQLGVQEKNDLTVRFTGNGFVSTGSLYNGSVFAWNNTPENMQFHKLDSAGIFGNCGTNFPAFSSETFSLQKQKLTWVVDSALTINGIAPPAVKLVEATAAMKSLCPAYVDSCSVLMVKGPSTVCNINKEYTYKAGRNNKCPQAVDWTYGADVIVMQQTDSSLTVRYTKAGKYQIKAMLKNSCSPVADSMQVKVTIPFFTLNLGDNRELCQGNSLALHASPVFSSYRWQDGSTDSVLTVTTPGLYWVETTDNCDNVWRDSVLVTGASGFTINAGPDRAKCNDDTLQLAAPAGYRSYRWTTVNNFSFSDTAKRIIINPLQTTSYFLQAEQSAGCFGFDTIHITVYRSPAIALGADTSLCAGDSLVLRAPAGFASYLWSNGSAATTIKASLPGNYRLMATTPEGCKSADTIRIISNYPLPAVSIAGSEVLCAGSRTLLDAGALNNAVFLWNTGETTKVISVNKMGIFSVNVTDVYGCLGRDSFEIKRIADPPRFFLPPDTSICNYSKLELRSTTNFQSYVWSNNAVTAGISVSSGGLYSLTVKDANNCQGTDSIRVDIKDCLTGCYVPTAFTPNRDGLNDVFKPLIFGDLRFYELMLYDRWGKLVFSSNDYTKGWDGTISGSLQGTGLYAWICRYRFSDAPIQSKSGTVLLMR